jgi:predicted nucleotidyltransferase
MLLNNPTEGILSDSLAELLRVLNRMTPGRTGRVLARSCDGVSVTQVNALLRRLERIGLVRSEPVPPAKQYFLNKQHALCAPLIAIAEARSEALAWLSQRAQNLPGLVSAIVFGSAARGEETHESDLDLLLVFDSDEIVSDEDSVDATLRKIFELESEFFERYGIPLGIIRFGPTALRANIPDRSPFTQNVVREGKVLVGEGLAQILERLSIETADGDSPQASK